MPQHKMTLDNQPGAAFRADLNKALEALATNSSGPNEPATKYPFQLWVDSGSGLLRMRYADNSQWVPLMQVNTPMLANYGPVAPGAPQPHQLWADTNSGLLKMRNQANTAWVDIGSLNTKNLGIAQIEPGMLAFSMSGIVEPGFLKANGAAVSRVAYANLFAKIGTRYGAGDGSTTFNLPEARGEFLRALDDGRGVDAGRALGSFQAQDIQTHYHPLSMAYRRFDMLNSMNYDTGMATNLPFNRKSVIDDSGYAKPETGDAGGAETRPRNIAALVLIKY